MTSNYDYKKEWVNTFYGGEKPKLAWIKAIQPYFIPGAVLEVMCGSGRWANRFESYFGVDISHYNITVASMNNPTKEFHCADIVEWIPRRTYSNVFSWVALQHIPKADFERLAPRMLEWSENFIFCEKTDGNDNAYTFTHNYERWWRIKSKQEIESGLMLMHLAKK